jgi:hypothetical protein
MMPMFRKKMESDKKAEEKPIRKIIIPGDE